MSDIPKLLARVYLLAATKRMAVTRRENVDYRLGLVGELLEKIIADLEPLPEMEAGDDWAAIEDEMDSVFNPVEE